MAMNSTLRTLTRDRTFWTNADTLAKVLAPAKKAVKMIESKTTTMGDVFLTLIQMATAIKALPLQDSPQLVLFRKQCIQFYNKQWKEFDTSIFMLAYFLHSKYREKAMRPNLFHQVIRCALEIW